MPGARPVVTRVVLLTAHWAVAVAQAVKSWILGWLIGKAKLPDIVIVGLVLFATKLYHTSFLFPPAAPQAPATAVYVEPTKVPAVLTQPVEEFIGVAVAQALLCDIEKTGDNKNKPVIKYKPILLWVRKRVQRFIVDSNWFSQ